MNEGRILPGEIEMRISESPIGSLPQKLGEKYTLFFISTHKKEEIPKKGRICYPENEIHAMG